MYYSVELIKKVNEFYNQHKEFVEDLITNNLDFTIRNGIMLNTTPSIKPSYEDLNNPDLWKGMHWQHYFNWRDIENGHI